MRQEFEPTPINVREILDHQIRQLDNAYITLRMAESGLDAEVKQAEALYNEYVKNSKIIFSGSIKEELCFSKDLNGLIPTHTDPRSMNMNQQPALITNLFMYKDNSSCPAPYVTACLFGNENEGKIVRFWLNRVNWSFYFPDDESPISHKGDE